MRIWPENVPSVILKGFKGTIFQKKFKLSTLVKNI